MTQEPDYYAILQVHPRAEQDIIDAAYRRLAAKYHPDVNPSPDATARMQQINAAHSVLSDPARRAAYDRSLACGLAAPAGDRAVEWGRQAWYYLKWFLVLLLLGEAFVRLGSRGTLIVLALGVLVYLLWKSRDVF